MSKEREYRTTDYKSLSCLYLETADRRMFSDEYSIHGDQYSGAVGKIYRSEKINRRDGWAELDVAYIKSITPEIVHPDDPRMGEDLPIRVISQEARGDELILEVVVDFSSPCASSDTDDKHRDGNTYTVVLFLESAKYRHYPQEVQSG